MDASPPRVLLIEDNPADAVLIREQLRNVDAPLGRLEWASTLEDGLALLGRGEFDAVLLDLDLGATNGVETLYALQRHAPSVAVVVLTGLAMERVALRALEAGAQDYLVKGQVRGPDLLRAVRYALERKRSRQALGEQRNLLESVLKTLPLSVVVVDRDGVPRMANPAARRELGPLVSPGPGGSGVWFAFDADQPVADESKTLQMAARGEILDEAEISVRGADGKTRCMLATVRPLAGVGSMGGGVAVLRDITQRRQAEEQVRALNARLRDQIREQTEALAVANAADRLKQNFLDVVSHELRTPLTPILGFARLLLRDNRTPLSPEQREWVELISDNARRMQRVVESILDFQGLHGESFKLRRVPVDVRRLVDRLAEQGRRLVARESVELTARVADDVPHQVLCDGDRVEQIVLRLLENSVTYTARGGIGVEVGYDVERRRLRVAVSDTGVGIEPEHLEYIFGAFYQAEPAGVGQPGGVGLGLAHARFLADAMDGALVVESEVDVGSTFTFEVSAPPVERLEVDAPAELSGGAVDGGEP